MKAYGQLEKNAEIPTIQVVQEGALTRIFFNFEEFIPDIEEGEEIEGTHFVCENVDVEKADYSSIISAIVRSKYTQDDVEAILSNYQLCKDGDAPEGKCDDYQFRYIEYQDWRATAKSVATEVMNLK